VNVTLTVHFVLVASVAPQLLVWAKSPVVEILNIVTAVLRLFARVTAMGGLVVPTVRPGNFIDGGDMLTGSNPFPVILTVCGLSLALSVVVRDPDIVPVTEGVKVAEIVHFAPARRVPQLFVSEKLALAAMPETTSCAEPVLVSTTLFTGLVVPTTTPPKERLVAESETLCAELDMAIDERRSSPRRCFGRFAVRARISRARTKYLPLIRPATPCVQSQNLY